MDTMASNYSSCNRKGRFPGGEEQQEAIATTLVLQTSIDRLWILNETCSRWKDPIVAVVFAPHHPDDNNDKSQQQKKQINEINLASCANHLQLIRYDGSPEESIPGNYPVNRLRNIGLDAATTSHILIMDVDFCPSHGLDDTIRTALTQQEQQTQQYEADDSSSYYYKQAIVVPAFEKIPPAPCTSHSTCAAYLQSNSSFIPQSFPDLQHCYYNTKSCFVFKHQVNWEGHYSTRSEAWLEKKWFDDGDQKKRLKSLPCFHTERYEPYVVLRWCPPPPLTKTWPQGKPMAPYYDERFYGYGKNKIELISHLRKGGYQFSVLPEGFVVHHPHPESSVKDSWKIDDKNKVSDHRKNMNDLYAKFLNELDMKYQNIVPHESIVGRCSFVDYIAAYLTVKARSFGGPTLSQA